MTLEQLQWTQQKVLKRGDEVINTGAPISVPVGPETLGRIINVVGESIDEKGEVKTKEKWPIHRQLQNLQIKQQKLNN